jgi:hypothetical protein
MFDVECSVFSSVLCRCKSVRIAPSPQTTRYSGSASNSIGLAINAGQECGQLARRVGLGAFPRNVEKYETGTNLNRDNPESPTNRLT